MADLKQFQEQSITTQTPIVVRRASWPEGTTITITNGAAPVFCLADMQGTDYDEVLP